MMLLTKIDERNWPIKAQQFRLIWVEANDGIRTAWNRGRCAINFDDSLWENHNGSLKMKQCNSVMLQGWSVEDWENNRDFLVFSIERWVFSNFYGTCLLTINDPKIKSLLKMSPPVLIGMHGVLWNWKSCMSRLMNWFFWGVDGRNHPGE